MQTSTSFNQFFKFAIVGVVNTGIDLAVLNGLIALFGLSKGDWKYVLYKAISFLFAVTNSFILNKFWVFNYTKDESVSGHLHKEITSFVTVSVIGIIINTAISTIVFTSAHTIVPSVSTSTWATVSALAGTCAVLISNFFGYKFWVFKKRITSLHS
ncbi:MAG: hypothetical protein RL094_655 [Candidatus Parcubacteria bacterium]|jgi:putative flippase GtrA